MNHLNWINGKKYDTMVKHDALVKVYGITQFVLSCFLFVIASMARTDGFSGNCLPLLLIRLHANEVQRHVVAPRRSKINQLKCSKQRCLKISSGFAFLLCKVYYTFTTNSKDLPKIEYLLVAVLGL